MSTDDFGSVKNRMLDAAIEGLELRLKKSKVGVGRPAKCLLKRVRTLAKQKVRREGIRRRIWHLISLMQYDD